MRICSILGIWVSLLMAHPQIRWTKSYGGDDDDVGCAIQTTSDGGFIVAGYTYSFGPTWGNVWLLKLDSGGDTVWTKVYDSGKDFDDAKSVEQTKDGGYLLVGNAGLGTTDGEIWVIKTDANGDTIWTRRYGGGQGDFGHCGRETSDGGYIIVGSTYRNYEYRIWVLKLNSAGDTIWSKIAPHASAGLSVRETSDGGYIIGGAYNTSMSEDKLWLIKLNSDGGLVWERTYDDLSGGRCIEVLSDGFIVTGSTMWGGFGDMYLLRVDPQGNEIWRKTYDRGEEECGRCVRQTPDGGYIVVGYSGRIPPYLIYILRADNSGDTLWTWLYEGSGDWDDGWAVDICNDGGYIISGAIGPGDWDLHLIRTYPEPKVESGDNMFPITKPKVFPNPFGEKTNIYFQLSQPTSVKISLYNSLGERLRERILSLSKPGAYLIPFDGRNLRSGVYFLRAEFASTRVTFKIIKR